VLEGLLSNPQLALSVIPHAVYLSQVLHNESRVVLATADLLDDDVEAAYFGHCMRSPLKPNPQLSMVIIYQMLLIK
jgi:hypothetical protein